MFPGHEISRDEDIKILKNTVRIYVIDINFIIKKQFENIMDGYIQLKDDIVHKKVW